MRVLLVFILIAFFASCKGKQETGNSMDNQQSIEKLRDSLESSIDIINDRIAELQKEQERLLKSTSEENPVLKNIEDQYLELLGEREKIQIQLANLQVDL